MLFRLQDFGELVSEPELNLSPASYIDGYNPDTGLWEQIKLATVRTVEQDQRLLFRIRPRMLESLSDCPSLEQELALQPEPQQQHLKRAAPESDSPVQTPNKQARVISNSVPVVSAPLKHWKHYTVSLTQGIRKDVKMSKVIHSVNLVRGFCILL